MNVPRLVSRYDENGVAVLLLNSPNSLNAFTLEMVSELSAAVTELTVNEPAKPLVISGAGKAFSAGGNLKAIHQNILAGEPERYISEIVPAVERLFLQLLHYPGPTLSFLNGAAVGGGLNLAMVCDFRVMRQNAVLRLGFTDIGLTPGTGGSFFFTRILGLPRALSLSLLGGQITSTDALSWGLVNEVVGNDQNLAEVITEWSPKLTSLNPNLVLSVRSLMYQSLNTSIEDQMVGERLELLKASQTSYHARRVSDVMDRISR